MIIDRATWSAGRHIVPCPQEYDSDDELGNALLLSRSGQSCCLGFLGFECGLERGNATDVSVPSDVRSGARWPRELFADAPHKADPGAEFSPLKWETVFAVLNDDVAATDEERESWIAAGFRIVLGVDVEFVGEYPEVKP